MRPKIDVHRCRRALPQGILAPFQKADDWSLFVACTKRRAPRATDSGRLVVGLYSMDASPCPSVILYCTVNRTDLLEAPTIVITTG